MEKKKKKEKEKKQINQKKENIFAEHSLILLWEEW